MAKFSYSVGRDTGVSKVDRYTSGNANHSFSLTGTGNKDDSIVVSWLDPVSHAAKTSTTKVGSNGSWSITTPQLADGVYAFTIKETGTQTASVTAPAWTLDTKTNVNILGPGMDTGRSASDGITKGGISHTVLGTAEAGDTVLVTYVDAKGNRGALGTVTADGSGKWSIKTPVAPDGTYTVTALAMDKAGNTATTSFKAILDSVAPTTPTLTIKDDGGAVVASTTDNTLHVSGKAEANSTVAVSWKDAAGHSGTLSPVLTANGTWSVDTTALALGNYTFTATATDVAGNVSKASSAFNLKVMAPANGAPLGSDKVVDVQEDSGIVTVDLNKVFTDPDGDKLTYNVVATVNGPPLDYNPKFGLVTVDTNSAFFDSLNDGQTEKYVYNISADDGKGHTTTKTLTFNVAGHTDAPPQPVNHSPVVNVADPKFVGIEGSGNISGNVAFSIKDPDGDALTFGISNTSSHQIPINFAADGQLSIDTSNPSLNYLKQGEVLTESFKFSATDTHDASVQNTLIVSITGTNDAPYAKGGAVIIGNATEGTGLHTYDVKSAFIDPDGDTLAFSIVNGAAGFTLSPEGMLTFDANDPAYKHLSNGDFPTVGPTISASDGHGGSVGTNVVIQLFGVTDAPPLPINHIVIDGTGNYQATAAEDHFVFDYSILGNQLIGYNNVAQLQNFDPLADKLEVINVPGGKDYFPFEVRNDPDFFMRATTPSTQTMPHNDVYTINDSIGDLIGFQRYAGDFSSMKIYTGTFGIDVRQLFDNNVVMHSGTGDFHV